MKTTAYFNMIIGISLLLGCISAPTKAMALNIVDGAKGVAKLLSKGEATRMYSKPIRAMLDNIEQTAGKSIRHRVERLAHQHGTNAIRVLSKEPGMVTALERFSFKEQTRLLNSLATQPGLRAAFRKFGDKVLKLELRNPGQAVPIARSFGERGVQLAGRLTSKQINLLGQRASTFKGASSKTVTAFLDIVGKYTGKAFGWLEKHPKLLFTATAAILVHDMKSQLFGDPSTGTKGAVQQIADSGFNMLGSVLTAFAPLGAGVLFLWLCFRSWQNKPKERKNQTELKTRFWTFGRKRDDQPIDAVVK